jgi:prophage tail gpP-like protein
MTISINPKLDKISFSPVVSGGLKQQLQTTGKLPPVTVRITPIDGRSPVYLPRFISYQFSSSILVPVSSFNFTFQAPNDPTPISQIVKEGDIVTLFANGEQLTNGIVDTVDIDWDSNYGEKITISGRDLMGQLEDQDAVDLNSSPLYGKDISVEAAVKLLITNTRIQGFINQGVTTSPQLFATEPGESKLTALQRLLEGINAVTWLDPSGKIIIGKPNMSQPSLGLLCVSKKNRNTTNCLSMKITRSAATIPNIVIPIFSGQEGVIHKIGKQQGLRNAAPAPNALFNNGHVLCRSVVVSVPDGGSAPSDLANISKILAATQPGSSLNIQQWAAREIAKQNVKEVQSQVVIPGHYNDQAKPFKIDQVYTVQADRGGDYELNLEMYLYQVEYSLSEDTGQRTSLYFTKKGTIVANVSTSVGGIGTVRSS